MASPVVTTISRSAHKVVVLMTWTSAGSDDQTNFVIYSSATQTAAIKTMNGLAMTNPLTSTLNKVWASTNSAAAVMSLNFDSTTPVKCAAIPKYHTVCHDYTSFGGIHNTAGTGITGDITFTSSGIASGETVSIVLEVAPY